MSENIDNEDEMESIRKGLYAKEDYFKYYRAVFYFAKKKYNLTQGELDLILFLYSERRFTLKRIRDLHFYKVSEKKTMTSLINNKLVVLIQKRYRRANDLYSLTARANSMVRTIYDLIENRKVPPTTFNLNPLLRQKAAAKTYKDLLEELSMWAAADSFEERSAIVRERTMGVHDPIPRERTNEYDYRENPFARYRVSLIKEFNPRQEHPFDE
jgi:DNA-binding MarR family transcriptional regulator